MGALLNANALLALAAAVLWGGGDFCGGVGVNKAGGNLSAALRVVLYGHGASLALLLLFCVATHQPWPHGAPVLWALGGGITTALALAAFYLALSSGAMGSSAAVSGLLAAAVPAAVSSAIEGRPSWLRLAGFALALAAIWFISAQASNAEAAKGRRTLLLAIASGIGFGMYFVALRFANPLGIVMPMALARTGSMTTAAVFLAGLACMRRNGSEIQWTLPARALRWALAGAMLDLGGNLLFIAATRAGRLDVAAVLASLYPVSTIVLAGWMLGERLTRQQWAGMGIAAAAVVMITL